MKFTSDFSSAITLPLTTALLIYTGGNETLATIHPVEQLDNGATRIGPGKLPSERALKTLATELFSASGLQYLPPNVLAYSSHRIVWHHPSCRRRIWFGKDISSDRLKALNGRMVRWPALLFSASNRHMAVFALASDTRPEPHTLLYRAPFPNVEGKTGAVALCQARPPSHAGVETIAGFERSFYDTEFTHAIQGGIIQGDYEKLWEEMAEYPTQFPVATLKPTQFTLNSYLQSK